MHHKPTKANTVNLIKLLPPDDWNPNKTGKQNILQLQLNSTEFLSALNILISMYTKCILIYKHIYTNYTYEMSSKDL